MKNRWSNLGKPRSGQAAPRFDRSTGSIGPSCGSIGPSGAPDHPSQPPLKPARRKPRTTCGLFRTRSKAVRRNELLPARTIGPSLIPNWFSARPTRAGADLARGRSVERSSPRSRLRDVSRRPRRWTSSAASQTISGAKGREVVTAHGASVPSSGQNGAPRCSRRIRDGRRRPRARRGLARRSR